MAVSHSTLLLVHYSQHMPASGPRLLSASPTKKRKIKEGSSFTHLLQRTTLMEYLLESVYEPPQVLTQRPMAANQGREESPLVNFERLKAFVNESA